MYGKVLFISIRKFSSTSQMKWHCLLKFHVLKNPIKNTWLDIIRSRQLLRNEKWGIKSFYEIPKQISFMRKEPITVTNNIIWYLFENRRYLTFNETPIFEQHAHSCSTFMIVKSVVNYSTVHPILLPLLFKSVTIREGIKDTNGKVIACI